MKQVLKPLFAALPILMLAFSASAHDPSQHAKKTEKANCSALEKMKADKQAKGLKMDMNDLVVLAMMKKCNKDNKSAHAHHHSDDSEHTHSDHDEAASNDDNHSDGEHKH